MTSTTFFTYILFSPDRYVSFSLVFTYSIAPFNICKRKLSLANVIFLLKTSDVQFAICSNLLCYMKDSQKSILVGAQRGSPGAMSKGPSLSSISYTFTWSSEVGTNTEDV